MILTGAEITAWIGSYLWPFFRIGALVMAAPVFSGNLVPVRIRLGMAIAITAVVAPVLTVPAVDPFSFDALLIIVQQILIGVAMGFALALVFGAVVTGGQVVAMQMGLGFASMVDPQNGLQVPVISQLLLMMTTLLFLITDGHLVLIKMLVDSFEVLPIAADGLVRGGFWAVALWGREMFAASVWIALPAVASLLVANIAFGVMARAAPQLNIFAIGFPVFVISGYVVLLLSLPGLVPQFAVLVEQGFELISRILAGGE